MSLQSPKTRDPPTKEQRDAANPDQSVWVAASAGSGKTQVLIDRVIRLLLEGADPQAILCLTFTKAAAAEMSSRLFNRLGEWIALDDDALDQTLTVLGVKDATSKRPLARKLFAKALETPGGLKIQTIHAFCERLLQLFPVEAGLAPGFRVMENEEATVFRQQAFQDALTDPDPEIQAGWDFLEEGGILSWDALDKTALSLLSGNKDLRDKLATKATFRNLAEKIAATLGPEAARDSTAIEADIVAIDVTAYRKVAALLSPHKSTAHPVYTFLATTAAAPTKENVFKTFFTAKGTPRKKLLIKETAQALPDLDDWLTKEQNRVAAAFDAYGRARIFAATLAVYAAIAGVLARLNQLKRQRGLYDFDDLISRTAALLQSTEQARWVLYKLDAGLQHILVDEAQDTSPAQWKIIQALADEFFSGQGRDYAQARTVFVVGDRKQSIYSFQGADTAAFEMARQNFASRIQAAQKTLKEVGLTISYRSTSQVLQIVDTTFAKNRLPRQGYGAHGADERDHAASRDKDIGVFELWPLVAPSEKAEPDYWQAPVDLPPQNHPQRVLARKIADRIAEWIGKRQLVSKNRAVAPGDILILLQRRNLLFRALIAELRRRDIKVAGADRLKLQESLIIHDMLALGQFIRMPGDDHALACLLKSPLVPVALNEDALFNLCYGRAQTSLWQRLREDAAQLQNYQHLQRWRDLAITSGPFGFFARVMQERRREILRRLGPEAEDAGQAFLDRALDHEQQEGPSLTAFLDAFEAGDSDVKREMDQAAGEVRIMTVHGAKGLEAPIVFLPDAADADDDPRAGHTITVPEGEVAAGLSLFVPELDVEPDLIDNWKAAAKQKQLEERMRLLYVGMTRARDELYICGSHNMRAPKDESWWAQIAQAITQATGLADLRAVSQADGSQIYRFGAEPVAAANNSADKPQHFEMPAWAKALPPRVAAPLQLLAQVDSQTIDVAAAKRGIAIHRLLETMAELPPDQRATVAKRRAAKWGLEPALVQKLVELLQRPELQMFFGPGSAAEVSLRGRRGEDDWVTSRIDRLVERDGTLYVLDYKSGTPPDSALPEDHAYRQQMARYRQTLQDAYPGKTVKAALLWTQTATLEWLDN